MWMPCSLWSVVVMVMPPPLCPIRVRLFQAFLSLMCVCLSFSHLNSLLVSNIISPRWLVVILNACVCATASENHGFYGW